MKKWKREVCLSATLMALSLIAFIYCGTMKTDLIKVTAAKPDVYLRMWLGVLFVLAAIMLIRALRERSEEELPKIWGKLQIFTVILFAVYLLAMPSVGFVIATLIFMMIVTTVYNFYYIEEIPKGKNLCKHLMIYAVFSIICTYATEFLFRNILSVNLPKWNLF